MVDDCSTDGTDAVIAVQEDPRLVLLRHVRNRGAGAAIATGLQEARRRDADIAVIIDGDGQMRTDEIASIIAPLTDDEADYVKGNRFAHEGVSAVMPKGRYIGNLVATWLTRVVSGFPDLHDAQNGFLGFNRRALMALDIPSLDRRFGYPNDLLTRARLAGLRIRQVPVTPVYAIGEQSKLNALTEALPMGMLLLRLAFLRAWHALRIAGKR